MDETRDEGHEPGLAALAERLVELREEKRYLDGEIETVSARLAEALGQNVKTVLGTVEVRVGEARPGIRVVNEAEVPAAFLSPKPDRKLLLEHVRTTGEVPAGVKVTEGRASVYAKTVAGD